MIATTIGDKNATTAIVAVMAQDKSNGGNVLVAFEAEAVASNMIISPLHLMKEL